MMIGISLRFALAAGLHLRNDNPSITANKKETLVRTWWGLHCIESFLCTIIGRPCIIPNDECTVPLPKAATGEPIDDSVRTEESMRSARGDLNTVRRSSLLDAHVAIALIIQKTLAKLYAPQLSVDSWGRIQTDITTLRNELDEWATTAQLAGSSLANSFETGIERTKLILSFHYYSTELLICRPCLCRTNYRNKCQSDSSVDFYQKTADICVQAAQAVTKLLPDQLNLQFIYEKTPWWCIVHVMMQAFAVLVLKMSFGKSHRTHKGEKLSGNVTKLARWLRYLSVSNDVAHRAYNVVLDIIQSSASCAGIDVVDITSDEIEFSAATTESYQSFSRLGSSESLSPRHLSLPSQSYPTNTSPYSFAPSTGWTTSLQDLNSPAASTTTRTSTSHEPSPKTTPFNVNLDAHFAASPVEQQQPSQQGSMPHQNYETHSLNPDFTFDAGWQMPSVFGNPFLTNFDQADVLAGVFGTSSEGSSGDDVWMSRDPGLYQRPN
jgi:hypothetical protein